MSIIKLPKVKHIYKLIVFLVSQPPSEVLSFVQKYLSATFSGRPDNIKSHIKKSEVKRIKLVMSAEDKKAQIVTRKELLKYKSSDTLFVLGGGPSINKITPSQWNDVEKNDSIAVNWFHPHDVVPTYYHIELAEKKWELFEYCYKRKPPQKKKGKYILNYNNAKKYLVAREPELKAGVYFSVPSHFKSITAEDELRSVLDFYANANGVESGRLIHFRGSLTLVMSIGVMLGYTKIVLCGFDMRSMDYFFFDETKYNTEIAKKVRSYKKKSISELGSSCVQNGFHKTTNPGPGAPPLDIVVRHFDEAILKPRGIRLYLSDSGSLLYPSVPLYNFSG